MPARLRIDPLTASRVVLSAGGRKPRPAPRRTLPAVDGTCPFCPAPTGHLHTAVILDRDGDLLTVDNPYAVFADGPDTTSTPSSGLETTVAGAGELVIPRQHLTSLTDFDDAGVRAFARHADSRRARLARTYRHAGMFCNVGTGAGASQQHLHMQVVAADLPVDLATGSGIGACIGPGDECRVCLDEHLARQAGQVIATGPDWTAWIPWAPSAAIEVRIAARDCEPGTPGTAGALLAGARAVIAAADATGYPWPYTVIVHNDAHPHAHLLLPDGTGAGMLRSLGTVVIGHDLPQLARTWAQARTWPAHTRPGSPA